ncbi:hypothetical protein A8H26_03015 [Pluralibacter gergoviae]|nr:hypothetical protein A8H26_03015 [Pluralibacter gergoviae]
MTHSIVFFYITVVLILRCLWISLAFSPVSLTIHDIYRSYNRHPARIFYLLSLLLITGYCKV